ncbi:hypothetical protein [Niallia sp. 03133]|uniref:hypothetical protein n=1 Tax=Niallia sp. 03133 TaxID=3458060 RepID=UPI0040440E51
MQEEQKLIFLNLIYSNSKKIAFFLELGIFMVRIKMLSIQCNEATWWIEQGKGTIVK